MADALQELRDAILLQADYLNTHAEQLDDLAAGQSARVVLEGRLRVAAFNCRARAKLLNEMLAASEPREAS